MTIQALCIINFYKSSRFQNEISTVKVYSMIRVQQNGYLLITILFVLFMTVILNLFMPTYAVHAGDFTVCADGCDFMTIQEAINSPDIQDGQRQAYDDRL